MDNNNIDPNKSSKRKKSINIDEFVTIPLKLEALRRGSEDKIPLIMEFNLPFEIKLDIIKNYLKTYLNNKLFVLDIIQMHELLKVIRLYGLLKYLRIELLENCPSIYMMMVFIELKPLNEIERLIAIKRCDHTILFILLEELTKLNVKSANKLNAETLSKLNVENANKLNNEETDIETLSELKIKPQNIETPDPEILDKLISKNLTAKERLMCFQREDNTLLLDLCKRLSPLNKEERYEAITRCDEKNLIQLWNSLNLPAKSDKFWKEDSSSKFDNFWSEEPLTEDERIEFIKRCRRETLNNLYPLMMPLTQQEDRFKSIILASGIASARHVFNRLKPMNETEIILLFKMFRGDIHEIYLLCDPSKSNVKLRLYAIEYIYDMFMLDLYEVLKPLSVEDRHAVIKKTNTPGIIDDVLKKLMPLSKKERLIVLSTYVNIYDACKVLMPLSENEKIIVLNNHSKDDSDYEDLCRLLGKSD